MFLRTEFDYFVTLSDITQKMEGYNPVIYNPGKNTIPYRCELLYRTIKEHTGVELTSEELIHLTKYEIHELKQFVFELREIVTNKRKAKFKK